MNLNLIPFDFQRSQGLGLCARLTHHTDLAVSIESLQWQLSRTARLVIRGRPRGDYIPAWKCAQIGRLGGCVRVNCSPKIILNNFRLKFTTSSPLSHDYKASFDSTWRSDLCITKHLMENITRCICPLSGTYVVMLTKKQPNVSGVNSMCSRVENALDLWLLARFEQFYDFHFY